MQVTLHNLRVQNKGWRLVLAEESKHPLPETERMRGFRILRLEQNLLQFDEVGPSCVKNITIISK